MKPKFISMLLLLFLIALPLLSCEKKEPAPDETTDGETDMPSVSVIDLEELEEYTIIRPEKLSSELLKAVTELRAAIEEKTGAVPKIKTDFYREGFDGFDIGEKEILIGECNRDETRELLSNLRYRDYGFKTYGEKVVIAGHSDEYSIKAVEEFTKKILSRDMSDGVFVYSGESLLRGSYENSAASLGGVDVNGLTVVYPRKAGDYEKEISESLARLLSEKYGFRVYTSKDSDYDLTKDGPVLSVGNVSDLQSFSIPSDLGGGESYIAVKGNRVILAGGSAFALYNTVGHVKELIEKGGSAGIELKAEERLTVEVTELKVMSFNLWVSQKTDTRTANAVAMIMKYLPDTFGVQEASPAWMNDLKKALPMYASVGGGRDGGSSGEHSAVFYLKDKFTLIEEGTKWLSDTPDKVSKVPESSLNRILSYAVLKRNSDGKEFVHVNTHLEHTSDAARQRQASVLLKIVKKFASMPIVLTGDFNAEVGSSPYNTVTSGGFKPTYELTSEVHGEGTFHGNSGNSKLIDFVFVTPGSVRVLSHRVCDEKINGAYVSDHHPVLATVVLG